MTFILGSKGTNSILRRRQKNKENTETRYTMHFLSGWVGVGVEEQTNLL